MTLCSANRGCGTASLCNQAELISHPFVSLRFPLYRLLFLFSQHLLLNVHLLVRAEIDVSAANNLFLKKKKEIVAYTFPYSEPATSQGKLLIGSQE